MRAIWIIFLICFLSAPAFSEPLSFDIAREEVEITSGFTGTRLTVFGMKDAKGQVAVVIEGPEHDIIVRRKNRILGAWINTEWMRFEKLPAYYDFALDKDSASSDPEFLSLQEDVRREKRLGLGALKALKAAEDPGEHDAQALKVFQNALVRQQQKNGVYPKEASDIQYITEDLFRVDFNLPANLPSGEYKVRALLIDGGEVAYEQQKSFNVGLKGFNATTFEFAHGHGFLYGFLCVLLAIVAGWVSNFIVRRS